MLGRIQSVNVYGIVADVVMNAATLPTKGVAITASVVRDCTIQTAYIKSLSVQSGSKNANVTATAITTLSVKGSFENSNVNANTIGTATLYNVAADNGDVLFGLTAASLKKLTLKQGDLVGEAIHRGGLPGARIEGVGTPTAGVGKGELGHGDDVQDGGLDVLGPAGGQRHVRNELIAQGQASGLRYCCRGQRLPRALLPSSPIVLFVGRTAWKSVDQHSGKVFQRLVLYLGEINDSQQAAWRKTLSVVGERGQERQAVSLFPDDRPISGRQLKCSRHLPIPDMDSQTAPRP